MPELEIVRLYQDSPAYEVMENVAFPKPGWGIELRSHARLTSTETRDGAEAATAMDKDLLTGSKLQPTTPWALIG